MKDACAHVDKCTLINNNLFYKDEGAWLHFGRKGTALKVSDQRLNSGW